MDLKELIYNFKTRNKEGFVQSEIDQLLTKFPDINMDKFNNALNGITCIMDDIGDLVIYHVDVLHALQCGIDDRELEFFEWD